MADSKPEVSPRAKQGRDFPLLALGLKYLPLWAAVAAGLWTLWTYVGDEAKARVAAVAQAERDSRARLLEAQKPFLDKQLALYFETAEVAGILATTTPGMQDPTWTSNYARFQRLYWSELSMVEHPVVEAAMVDFRKKLLAFADGPGNPTAEAQSEVQQSSLRLAHAIRAGIQSSWGDPNTVARSP